MLNSALYPDFCEIANVILDNNAGDDIWSSSRID